MLLRRMLCISIVAVFFSTLALALPTIPVRAQEPIPYEDFRGYSELDPNSHITVNNATHVSFDAWRNEDARLWRDMRENYFDDFQHELDFNWTDQDNWSVCPIWGLTNDLNDYRGLADANKTHIWLFVRREFDSTYILVIRENFNGTHYVDRATISLDTMYYVTINKVGTTFWANVYDSASRQPANLIDQVQIDLHGDWTFRYILVCNTLDSDHAIHGVVDIYRLNMHAHAFVDHDLTLGLDAPSILELGDSWPLDATVINWGLSNESDVELFLMVDGTIVESATIPELLTRSSYTLSYLWSPTVEGSYNVTAYAPAVSGENITTNNIVTKIVDVTEQSVVYVDQETTMAQLGDTFVVEIKVANVADLYAHEFTVFWDTALLDCVGSTINRIWYPNDYVVKDEILENYDATHGRYWCAYLAYGPGEPPFNGDTTLVSLTFETTGLGTSTLDLYDVTLVNSEAEIIEDWDHKDSPEDGYVTIQESTELEADVNNDGIVDIVDLVTCSLAFGSEPGDTNWDPRADIAKEFGLIDVVDLVMIAIHLGETQ